MLAKPFSLAKRIAVIMDRIEKDIYPENDGNVTNDVTNQVLDRLSTQPYWPPRGALVLDVGCGRGVALQRFRDAGLTAFGLTIGEEDAKTCESLGFDVIREDMTFTSFSSGYFDMLFARHCLEHSCWPMLTLYEFNRLLKPNGLLYAEMPAPSTSSWHEANENHYSVLTSVGWKCLLSRTGFKCIEYGEIKMRTVFGEDVYYMFICQKEHDV